MIRIQEGTDRVCRNFLKVVQKLPKCFVLPCRHLTVQEIPLQPVKNLSIHKFLNFLLYILKNLFPQANLKLRSNSNFLLEKSILCSQPQYKHILVKWSPYLLVISQSNTVSTCITTEPADLSATDKGFKTHAIFEMAWS